MATLTSYLQVEFARHCPDGWECRHEIPLLPRELEELLGYAPRADVLLERRDHSRRLWIEFEVSRADPVANHAKFATAHLFQAQPATDSFVAMVSTHVARGRRNLAANMIHLMRRIGMNAFQTVLLPQLSAGEIQRLNHADIAMLSSEQIPLLPEIQRAIAVSEPVIADSKQNLHLVGDLIEVMLNVRQWNREIETAAGKALWGKRTVTYFVFDARSGTFAPSKFCAYVPVPLPANYAGTPQHPHANAVMTLALYVNLDGIDSRFDGHRAWTHLTGNLVMVRRGPQESSRLMSLFEQWLGRNRDSIIVHPNGPAFLSPPEWFR